jgi:septal ring factor EnvC (AmiA/AmiB activator)
MIEPAVATAAAVTTAVVAAVTENFNEAFIAGSIMVPVALLMLKLAALFVAALTTTSERERGLWSRTDADIAELKREIEQLEAQVLVYRTELMETNSQLADAELRIVELTNGSR